MEVRRHIPNLLSGLRIALVPVLLWLAWTSHPTAFLVTFAFSLSTDLLDGYLARRMRTGTELGAKLDSWGDLATYAVFPLCAWWLFRERVLDQWTFVVAALIAFVAPTLVGLLKFRRITSYHTRLAKLVAIVMGAGLILYLGFDLPRVFQAAVLFLLVEAIEEIAITAVLPEWRANVPSLFAALRLARETKPAAMLALALLGLPGGVTAQTALPDLVPEVSNVHVELFANVDAGDVAEGCAPRSTGLDLVRLDLTTVNQGAGELSVGDPECPNCLQYPGVTCGHADFICSPAGGHNHPHYANFLRYEILDEYGGIAAIGGKRSFCLAESGCGAPRSHFHSCQNQGLYPGCWDLYPYWLGCQYVDVSHLPDGPYTLRVTVDPQARFAESSESNNVIEQEVLLFRSAPAATPLPTGNVRIKAEKSVSLLARATEEIDLGFGGRLVDPTHGGAKLYVSDRISADEVGDQVAFDLPAAGWKRVGKETDPRVFRYKSSAKKDGDCSVVELTRKQLRSSCNLRGEHKHFELPVEGNVFAELRVGSLERRFCASFGGKDLRNDERVVQRRRRQPKPLDCDTGEVLK